MATRAQRGSNGSAYPATGLIVLVHGSRGERREGERLAQILHRLKARLGSQAVAEAAALQFNHPTLEEAIVLVAEKGVRRVVVVPYFLWEGTHLNEDIPEAIEKLQSSHPDLDIRLAKTLGVDDRIIDIVLERMKEALDWQPAGVQN